MRALQNLPASPVPGPRFGVPARSSANDMPAELLQSALHWLTAHPPPPDLRDSVARLVEKYTAELMGRAAA